jgi:uncharacterized protein YcbK (DUF882 family)
MSPNFSREEFACKDQCGLDKIDPDLVDELQRSRDKAGIPYEVSSGCRCAGRNKQEGGADDSAHTLRPNGFCGAADIECLDMLSRKKILADVTNRFRHIGIHKLFIHVDNDPTKPEGVYLY